MAEAAFISQAMKFSLVLFSQEMLSVSSYDMHTQDYEKEETRNVTNNLQKRRRKQAKRRYVVFKVKHDARMSDERKFATPVLSMRKQDERLKERDTIAASIRVVAVICNAAL